jgi:radical SAM protein with 4Fe4S-binding SPASM domain
VLASYYAARATKRPVVWGRPFSVSFEPTTACNLRCPECPSGLRAFTRPTGMLKPAFFERVIDELAPELIYLIFYFQGEPYLNPSFLDMAAYAAERGIYHYLHDENARRTVESGLDRLIVSIDGTDQETYQAYRVGGKLEKVLEGTRNVVAWKRKLRSRTPHVIFQFLVVRPNEHQIDEVHRLGAEIGVDEVRLKTAQIYDFADGSDLIPTQDRYSRYRQGPDGKWSIKSQLLNHCWKLWHSCVITWDGQVVPCCFDKDAAHRLGDLQTSSFREVWRSEPYDRFRRAVLRSRSEIDICRNCTEGLQVWA